MRILLVFLRNAPIMRHNLFGNEGKIGFGKVYDLRLKAWGRADSASHQISSIGFGSGVSR